MFTLPSYVAALLALLSLCSAASESSFSVVDMYDDFRFPPATKFLQKYYQLLGLLLVAAVVLVWLTDAAFSYSRCAFLIYQSHILEMVRFSPAWHGCTGGNGRLLW